MIVFAGGLRIESIAGAQIPLWVSFICTVLWVLVSTNALNLIDGLDGLCAGMGLLATLTLFGAALLYGNMPLAHATFPLAGALLGFLCYNFNPATVFLGDSGALLIGFLLGCYGMIWTQKSATLLSVTVPLLALSIPLMDVSLSVVRRFIGNRPIFGADRGHIHHRLLDRGLSARQAVLVLYVASTIPAALALLLAAPSLGKFQALIIVLFCGAAWFGIRQLRYSEFDMVGRLLFGGEFKRAVDSELRLTSATTALNSALSEEEWWGKVIDVARDMKWVRVTLLNGDIPRHRIALGDPAAAWVLQIALGENETLQVEGSSTSAGPKIDLIAFTEIAARSYAATRSHWQSAAVS